MIHPAENGYHTTQTACHLDEPPGQEPNPPGPLPSPAHRGTDMPLRSESSYETNMT